MASTSAVPVRYEDPNELRSRQAVLGFLAGYSGATLVSYSIDLRLFAGWCSDAGVRLFAVKRSHLELFARHMEAEGKPQEIQGPRPQEI